MKKVFLFFIGFFLSVNTHALSSCEIQGTDGLSDAMVQQLKSQCEQMKLNSQHKLQQKTKNIIPNIEPEIISSWSLVAEGFAKALGTAAKEIGIGVNEFIKTPAGFLTVLIVAWSFFAKDIVLLLVMILFWGLYISKTKGLKIERYELIEIERWGKKITKKLPVFKSAVDPDDWCIMWFYGIPAIIVSILVCINIG